MGSAVLQYSHCSSDTARRCWAGRTGDRLGARALGRRASGRRRAQGTRAGGLRQA